MDPKKLKGIIKYFMFILSGCVIFLTTIFGIYSSVFIQHTEYNYKLSYWINPINIIDFTKTHKHLNEENYIQKVELSSSILQPDKAEKKTYNYCFIVDVTKSLTSSEELYGYIKSKVDIEAKYDELSKICESALSSIVLHTLIAFETNSDYDLWLYKGELTDKVWGNLKHINPFLLDDEKKDLDMTVYIKTKEALRVFNSEIDKNGDITTNIGKLFKSSFKKFDKDSIVLNIISDFKHEGDDEIALQQIESSINDIGDRIHQINLFVIGDTTGNKVLTALESTLGALDIYYYPYIFEDKFNLNENKIKSYSSTTIDQSQNQSISFYRPFSSKNNEDNYKSNIYINGFDNSYLLTLRNSTQKSVGKNPLIRLKMKDKTGFLRLNKMQELSADRIKMTYLQNAQVGSGSVFAEFHQNLKNDDGPNFTLRYPILFKDKLPKTATFLFVLFLTILTLAISNLLIIRILSFFNIKFFVQLSILIGFLIVALFLLQISSGAQLFILFGIIIVIDILPFLQLPNKKEQYIAAVQKLIS